MNKSAPKTRTSKWNKASVPGLVRTYYESQRIVLTRGQETIVIELVDLRDHKARLSVAAARDWHIGWSDRPDHQ